MAARATAAAPALLLLLLAPPGAAVQSGGSEECTFDNEPVFPNYFWDPTCVPGALGCQADGKHLECRFCGGGAYANISCRASSCTFVNEPFVPYYWDPSCKLGDLGCWADGVHTQCRFCGEAPYTSLPCPADHVGGAVAAACTFKNEPTAKYGWDPSCRMGMLGCLADGVHTSCRYCEEGPYANISCAQNASKKECTFVNEPTVPYFWDNTCTVGQLGCLADGVHAECRFCAHRPFESIPCPGAPAAAECTFPPLRSEPKVPYYWDPTCAMGVLGCWADGLHAQCRYCGSGVYSGIACPADASFPEGAAVAASAAVATPAAEAAQKSGLGDRPAQAKATEAVAPGRKLGAQPAAAETPLSGAPGRSLAALGAAAAAAGVALAAAL